MDIGWDAPPDEDFNALLDDEDELEYIREIEIEQKRKQIEDIENLLENSGKVRNGGIAQLRHSSDIREILRYLYLIGVVNLFLLGSKYATLTKPNCRCLEWH